MGRFCRKHARERTSIELEGKVEKLNKLVLARTIKPNQYDMLVRCERILDIRGRLPDYRYPK